MGGVPSGLIINVRLGSAEDARDVANDLLYSFVEKSRERSIGTARDTLDLFTSQELRVVDEIEGLEASIADFKQANSDYMESGLVLLRSELGDLRESSLDID